MYVVFVLVLFYLIARRSTVILLLFRLATASAVCWAILPWCLLLTRSSVIILLFRPLHDFQFGRVNVVDLNNVEGRNYI